MSQGLSRLYKDVLKAASGFKDKNFREYFTRIAKDDFERVSKTMPETEFVKVQTDSINFRAPFSRRRVSLKMIRSLTM